ncbi:MAG: hypothetical protein ACFB22_01955 [Rhodothalassiaceae bacterium]
MTALTLRHIVLALILFSGLAACEPEGEQEDLAGDPGLASDESDMVAHPSAETVTEAPAADQDSGAVPVSPQASDDRAPYADIGTARPEVMEFLYKGPFARVIEIALPPGASIPRHVGGPRLIYALSDYALAYGGEDDVLERQWQKGQVHTHAAGVHEITNTGEDMARFVLFERLSGALPEVGPTLGQADETDRPHSDLLHDGEGFRAVRVTLDAGATQQTHQGGYRAVYMLSDAELDWRSDAEDEQTPQATTWQSGSLHMMQPGRHAATNRGDAPASWLVVHFKR